MWEIKKDSYTVFHKSLPSVSLNEFQFPKLKTNLIFFLLPNVYSLYSLTLESDIFKTIFGRIYFRSQLTVNGIIGNSLSFNQKFQFSNLTTQIEVKQYLFRYLSWKTKSKGIKRTYSMRSQRIISYYDIFAPWITTKKMFVKLTA